MEKADFARNGLLIRRGLVPRDLTQRAIDLVAAWYGDHLDSTQVNLYTQRTFAPDLGSHPDVLAMLTASEVNDLVRSLVGDISPVTTAQIQIRLPDDNLGAIQPEKAMHIDGVSCPHLDPAELRTFTLLAGVVLSDISGLQSGPLRYVPGGHLRMAQWFRSKWAIGMTDQVPPQIDAEQGTPFLGTPGDVLLMHHLVPHAVGRNHTTTPRVMAYFRISHVGHSSQRLAALRDPWLEYPTLQNLTDGR